MKRSPLRRKRARRIDRETPGDRAYLDAVRRLPCCAPSGLAATLAWGTRAMDHEGRIHAHHAGSRPGVAMKAPDNTAIALCEKHHRAWHDATGVFRGWSKSDRRMWADAAIDDTRRLILEGADMQEPPF